jgi:hypothetical protein
MTVHDNIDNFLAADLHGELAEAERKELHTHLVECAACRQLHQENKIMNKALEETLTAEKPDAAFEQRMLAGFRNRIPLRRGGLGNFIVDLMRLRSVRIASAAAVLLMLVQVGRMLIQEGGLSSPQRLLPAHGNGLADSVSDRIAGPYDELAQKGLARAFTSQSAEADKDQRLASLGKARGTKETSSSESGGLAGLTPASSSAATPARNVPEQAFGKAERVIATGSNISTAEEAGSKPGVALAAREAVPSGQAAAETTPAQAAALANRKLIRNATVELEIISFDDAAQKITAFASQERGYVATTGSEKQENGKLKGEIVVKVLPENLDRFLQKIRGLGELKNQTLGTEDVTKAYFDTEARLKNGRVMEQRLIDMLKRKSDDINDLLQVEKELGRVREEIEKMQGELKYWDSQVQFATVTISLAEKDMDEPAAFLLKEHAQLALYSPEVEKIYNDIKALASPKVQITNAQLNRDNTGRVSARISILIEPEDSDGVIGKVKAFGRVENFEVQTERIARGGNGMSENAKTKRDKVDLNIALSRDEQEQAFQQTSLRIRTNSVDEKAKALRDLAEKQSGRVLSSTFSRDPNGREFANVSLRIPMRNYAALMQSLNSLGKPEGVSVRREERAGVQIDEANAPADLSIQVYSQGNIVSQESGLFATLRRTLAESVGAIMWSLRMIGVAVAFLAPWAIAVIAVVWIAKRIARARRRS